MDDIYDARTSFKSWGIKCAWSTPTVYQARNPHDLTEDMKKEYCGYEHVQRILDNDDFIYKPSYEQYRELTHHVLS